MALCALVHGRSAAGTGPPYLQKIQDSTPNDPRFQPCTPTANSFVIQWATAPTEAQAIVMQRVMGDLALNHPIITLTEAEPLIRAASATVQ